MKSTITKTTAPRIKDVSVKFQRKVSIHTSYHNFPNTYSVHTYKEFFALKLFAFTLDIGDKNNTTRRMNLLSKNDYIVRLAEANSQGLRPLVYSLSVIKKITFATTN